jgi:hypothetical protein
MAMTDRGMRVALVAMLVAVEVFIGGLALTSIGAGAHLAWSHSQVPTKPVANLAAGLAPHVTIDDPESAIVVSTSSDGLVHVQNGTVSRSWGWDSTRPFPALKVSRTADGVSVTRPAYDMGFAFFSREETDLQVPAGARITIAHCQTADISGVRGGVDVQAQAGHIGLRDVAGNAILASTDDGHIEATGLQPQGDAPRVVLHSDDGRIEAAGLFPANGNYQFTTDEGHINLTLAQGSDVSIDASTDDGSVHIDGQRTDADSIRVGNGSSPMRVRSEDGSIHITTNGALQ